MDDTAGVSVGALRLTVFGVHLFVALSARIRKLSQAPREVLSVLKPMSSENECAQHIVQRLDTIHLFSNVSIFCM